MTTTIKENYTINLNKLVKAIALNEFRNDNAVVKGMYIVANLAGVEIYSKEFSNKVRSELRCLKLPKNS